ncbi:MAG: hypothetical protein CMF25_07995 [Kangiellaceae bacterium]|nr:hypothetical protein [Kangiellaceae bacterium]
MRLALSCYVRKTIFLPLLVLVSCLLLPQIAASSNDQQAVPNTPATQPASPKPALVALVTHGTHSSYDACLIGIRSGLQAEKHKPDITSINLKNTQPISWDKFQLVVAIGSKATSEILKLGLDNKILAVLLPKITYNQLVYQASDKYKTGTNISAVYLDQPVGRYLALINALAPQAKTVGVMLGEGASVYEAPLDESQHLYQLQVRHGYVKKGLSPLKALGTIIDRSDVLLALPDTSVYNSNTVPGILLSSYRKGIPLIGFSRAYIRAGALTGIYTLPQELGYQTSQKILAIHQQNYQKLPQPAFPDSFDISVNYQVARSLGFKNVELNKLKQRIAEHVKGENF